MIQEIHDTMTRTINPYLINYGYGCTIYDEQQVSGERKITNDFLIARVPSDTSKHGIFMCSFKRCGFGFYLENMEHSEGLEVYRAVEDRDFYYTIKKVTDKNNQKTHSKKSVFNKVELLVFVTKYFEEKESHFSSGTIESVENEFYEFIWKRIY